MRHLVLAENPRKIVALPLLIALCAVMILLAAGVQAHAATLSVVNTNDSGPGSLRQAMIDANVAGGTNAIDFAIPGAGIQSINLLSPLPSIANGLFIDGYSQAGSAAPTATNPATILIDLNGQGGGGSGLEFGMGSNGSRVRGLAIHGFAQNGVAIDVVINGVQIDGNIIGLNAAGDSDGNGASGVYANVATNVVVGGPAYANRNVISGNSSAGVMISGGSSNTVSGNFIGTDVTGTSSMGNATGIFLDGTDGATIGGNTAQARNLVAGSAGDGITLNTTTNTTISGNYVGLNAAGNEALPNGDSGIFLEGVSEHNTIGGNSATLGNVISGNHARGILIESSFNNVYGNLIGLDATGEVDRGNDTNGSGRQQHRRSGSWTGERHIRERRQRCDHKRRLRQLGAVQPGRSQRFRLRARRQHVRGSVAPRRRAEPGRGGRLHPDRAPASRQEFRGGLQRRRQRHQRKRHLRGADRHQQ